MSETSSDGCKEKNPQLVSEPTEHGYGIRVQESAGGAFLQAVNGEGHVSDSIFISDDEALELVSALAGVVSNE